MCHKIWSINSPKIFMYLNLVLSNRYYLNYSKTMPLIYFFPSDAELIHSSKKDVSQCPGALNANDPKAPAQIPMKGNWCLWAKLTSKAQLSTAHPIEEHTATAPIKHSSAVRRFNPLQLPSSDSRAWANFDYLSGKVSSNHPSLGRRRPKTGWMILGELCSPADASEMVSEIVCHCVGAMESESSRPLSESLQRKTAAATVLTSTDKEHDHDAQWSNKPQKGLKLSGIANLPTLLNAQSNRHENKQKVILFRCILSKWYSLLIQIKSAFTST